MKAAHFLNLSAESTWHIVILHTEITEMGMGTGCGKAESGRLLTEDICYFSNIHFKKQFIYTNDLILMFSAKDNSMS